MKLFVIAALIAVGTAARLEHLQQQQQLRQYLPPSQNSGHSSYQGSSNTGTYGSNTGTYGSNSGAYGSASAIPSSYGIAGTSSGTFGASGVSQSIYEAFPGVKNAYLPPKYDTPATSGSTQYAGSVQGFGAQNAVSQQYGQQGGDNQQYNQQTGLSQQYGQQSGLSQHYSQQSGLGQQYSQQSGISQHGLQSGQQYGLQNGLSQQYGQKAAVSQFDYQAATQSTHRFNVQSKYTSHPSAVNRQYLAPYSSYSSQNIPQQAFDEKTGYYY